MTWYVFIHRTHQTRNIRNKLQWNWNQNTKRFIHENAYEIVVWEITAILSREDELTAC